MSVNVTLTHQEMHNAVTMALQVVYNNTRAGRSHRWGMTSENTDVWGVNIEAMLAETALAKHCGVYHHLAPHGDRDKGDVFINGVPHEVRHTKYQNGCLLLHNGDQQDRKYWLITGAVGVYQIRGWILGAEGMLKKYWSEPQPGRGCYMVPQDRLSKAMP